MNTIENSKLYDYDTAKLLTADDLGLTEEAYRGCVQRSYDEGGATRAIRIATKDGSRRVYAQ